MLERHRLLIAFSTAALTAPACAPAPAPTVAAPAAPAPSQGPVASTSLQPQNSQPGAAEPSAEDKKKTEQARALEEDRAKWQKENDAETARWTPQLHAAAKALVDKSPVGGKDAILAAMKGEHRKPGASERDKYRHPAETLDFFGFKPTMSVLDIGPGEGWYTELLAPTLFKRGQYFATSADPAGPADDRGTFYAQRFKAFLDKAPEVYGKVQTVIVDSKAPKLDREGKYDLVLIMRGVHGMVNGGTLDTWLTEINRALKPGGVLGIEEHRAPAGSDPAQSAKKGYVPEAWLIAQAEAKGFKLAGKSEVNANPKDTKDYPEGVWTLPPTFRLGAVDHDKYAAIGESDRMTLKFVKSTVKPAK